MSNNKTIAIVGNPNCGKTTLFNGLTGGNIKTGNWPGVTVEKKEGTLKNGNNQITIVDLPGIYSFSAYSEDEKIARDYILSGEPQLIINIVDANNLERNLFLTTQLIEMKVPVLVVLNMMDIAEKQNIKINIDELLEKLGIPVVGITATKKADIDKLITQIKDYTNSHKVSKTHIEYPNELEDVINKWKDAVKDTAQKINADARWVVLKLLESDQWVTENVISSGSLSASEIEAEQKKIEKLLGDTVDIICADYRYGFIHSITKSVVKKPANRRSLTDKIDKVVLNRVLGLPLFLLAMYLTFWVTINIGGAFIDFFDMFFGAIFVDGFGALLGSMNAPEWLITMLAGGLGAGIQTVATFIPIIFMMFFMLSILEDSGYMARAAFVVDRFMRMIGLPGKSFVPMLVGFGCTVPAIMATRTLEQKKDRFMTIFMSPFMSCGARLPVYVLFGAAFFPKTSGLMVFALYMTGIILAILTGLLLKKTVFKGEVSHFIMELPPYHLPRLKHILIHTWDRLKQFMIRAGVVIIIVVLLLSFFNSLGTDGSFGNEDTQNSILATTSKSIAPVFAPMGVEKENWPAVIALFTGLFAKEVVVGTLNALYSQINKAEAAADAVEEESETEEEGFDLWAGIGEAFASIPEGLSGVFGGLLDPLGLSSVEVAKDKDAVVEELEVEENIFTLMQSYFTKGPMQAFAFLLFILIYFPCFAALGVIVREVGLKLATFIMVYLTVLGWVVATLFFQITVAHQTLWIVVPIIFLVLTVVIFYVIGKLNLFNFKEE